MLLLMKKLTKIRISTMILCALGILASFSANTSKAMNIGDFFFSFDDLISPINDVIYTGNIEKTVFKNLVSKFCSTMTNPLNNLNAIPNTDLMYNAKKSMFMYTLCSNTDLDLSKKFLATEWFSTQKTRSYIRITEDKDGKPENILTKSLPNLYSDTEDYIQQLFDSLIGSYVTIYQAGIYGYAPDSNKTDEDLINEFSSKYFPYGLDKSTPYIQICGNDKAYNYNKTCKKFKGYLASARNSLNSSQNMLYTELIHQIYLGKQQSSICSNKNKNYDMIACGLYTDLGNFINLVYNELFFYTAFAEYYKFALSIQPNFKNNENANRTQKTAAQQERIDKITANMQYSKDAIKLTTRMLKELQITFPLHIWFLMYAEGINTFAAEFTKLLTPIYTLSDIFKNVQIKD